MARSAKFNAEKTSWDCEDETYRALTRKVFKATGDMLSGVLAVTQPVTIAFDEEYPGGGVFRTSNRLQEIIDDIEKAVDPQTD